MTKSADEKIAQQKDYHMGRCGKVYEPGKEKYIFLKGEEKSALYLSSTHGILIWSIQAIRR